MARRRMIDPSIWQNEAFAVLSPLARILYIGMFSQADDMGRGRAKPVFLRSLLFPYDEDVSVEDVEGALREVAGQMNVALYEADGASYYAFENWTAWQRVDKPQPSRLPPPEWAGRGSRGNSENGSGNDSKNDSKNGSGNGSGGEAGIKEEKEKERKRREGKGAPPRKEDDNPFLRPEL